MQTQMNITNLSSSGILTNAPKGNAQSSGHNRRSQSSEQFSGFIEIMGAMLNFGAIAKESGNGQSAVVAPITDEMAEWESVFNKEWRDIDSDELVQMFWNLSQLIDPQKMNFGEEMTPGPLNDFIQDLVSHQPELFEMLKSQVQAQQQVDAQAEQTIEGEEISAKLLKIGKQSAMPNSETEISGIEINEAASTKDQKMSAAQLASITDSKIKADQPDLEKSAIDALDGDEKNMMPQPTKEMEKEFQPLKASDNSSQTQQAAFAQKLQPTSGENSNLAKETHPAMSGEQENTVDPVGHLKLDDGQPNDGDQLFGYDDQKNTAGVLSHDSGDHRTVSKGDFLSHELSATREAHLLNKENQSDIIRQIVQRMTLNSQGGQSKMQIHLKPEFLGDVHLQILTENHQVSVHMTADSLAVKEIVEQNLQHLKQELQHHGLEIQKFDVFVNNDNLEGKNSQGQAAFGQAHRQRQQRSGKRPEGGKDNARLSALENKRQNIQKGSSAISYFV